MDTIILALISCFTPWMILGIVTLLLSWKNRGKIESIQCSTRTGIIVQFSKSSRQR